MTYSVLANPPNPSTHYVGVDNGFGSVGGGSGGPITVKPPAPTIMMGSGETGVCSAGTPVTSNQNVVVGQLITFTGCVPSSMISVTSETWTPDGSFSTSTAVAGFSVSFDGTSKFTETLTQITNTSCTTATYCDFNNFYFISPGTYTFSFEYTLSNGNSSLPASITFVVSAPTPDKNGRFIEGADGETAPAAGPVLVYDIGKYAIPGVGTNTTAFLANGNNNDTDGISLIVSGDTPTGSTVGGWMFVQTISQLSFSFITSPTSSPFVLQPGLDTIYPATGAVEFTDSPGISLDSDGTSQFTAVGAKAENVQFTTYLMWDPQIPPAGSNSCHKADSRLGADGVIFYDPSTCVSIPVPVAILTWGFKGSAIKTLDPAQGAGANTWILNCGTTKSPTFGTGQPGFPN